MYKGVREVARMSREIEKLNKKSQEWRLQVNLNIRKNKLFCDSIYGCQTWYEYNDDNIITIGYLYGHLSLYDVNNWVKENLKNINETLIY